MNSLVANVVGELRTAAALRAVEVRYLGAVRPDAQCAGRPDRF